MSTPPSSSDASAAGTNGSMEQQDSSVAESKGGGYENDFEMDAGADEEPAEAPKKSPAKKKQTNRVPQGQDQGSKDVGENNMGVTRENICEPYGVVQ